MLRLLARLRIIKLVWLTDSDEMEYLTVKRKFRNREGYWCTVCFYTGTGNVILNEDGTCSGLSSYIKTWEDYIK